MKRFILGIITMSVIIGISSTIIAPSAQAIGEGGASAGANLARGDNTPGNFASGDTSIVRRAINLMLYGVGILSVVMLIWGGVRYVISGGNKESITAAKNTILYAIIGLLVALFAYAIINFVITTAISGGGSTTDV